MTLVVAIPATDSVVLASESQATYGPFKKPAQTKVFQVGTHILMGVSGSEATIQKIKANIEAINPVTSLATTEAAIKNAVWTGFREVLQSDARLALPAPDYNAILQTWAVDFLFVEANPTPCILAVSGAGGSLWHPVGEPAMVGSGALYALPMSRRYAGQQLTCKRAELLAYKTIFESVEVASQGIGLGIHVWRTNANGSAELSDTEMAVISDSHTALRAAEIKMLVESDP